MAGRGAAERAAPGEAAQAGGGARLVDEAADGDAAGARAGAAAGAGARLRRRDGQRERDRRQWGKRFEPKARNPQGN